MKVNEKALKFYRKKSMLSQKDMANKLNVSLSLYQSFEQGRRNPNYETVENIASILGVETYSILEYEKNYDFDIDNKIKVLADKQIVAKELISELKKCIIELEGLIYSIGVEKNDK